MNVKRMLDSLNLGQILTGVSRCFVSNTIRNLPKFKQAQVRLSRESHLLLRLR
ncbi:MAG: hypothetical protein NTY03_11615 [Candidatus Bathyarchaeota archaeon]|nr:hypothetical protein [Candidatus Bathyarchaeota archaeon]